MYSSIDEMESAARALHAEASRIKRKADALDSAVRVYYRAQFDATPFLDPPTVEEIAAARKRIEPYLNGYPQPMIDTRRLRISNRTATLAERRAVAAEDEIWKERR